MSNSISFLKIEGYKKKRNGMTTSDIILVLNGLVGT